MFNQEEKELALELAHKLEQRDYDSAYAMLSTSLQGSLNATDFRQRYDQMIPQDWGKIDPIELVDTEDFPFLYVVLGGDVYSERLITNTV